MKNLIYFLFFSVLFLSSCGPSKEEEARLRKKEDSLMEIERNKAINNANDLLATDTVKSVKDSVAEANKK